MTPLARPRAALEALEVARSLVGTGIYWWGTGDCDTPRGARSDCAGFAPCKIYNVRRHRPGYNRGVWSTVEDDVNVNSLVEDARHKRELVTIPDRPEPGDMIGYPTLHLAGEPLPLYGHIAVIESVGRVIEWDAARPDWSLLDIIQCAGPQGRNPGIFRSTAVHWNVVDRDKRRARPEWRTTLLRMVS